VRVRAANPNELMRHEPTGRLERTGCVAAREFHSSKRMFRVGVLEVDGPRERRAMLEAVHRFHQARHAGAASRCR